MPVTRLGWNVGMKKWMRNVLRVLGFTFKDRNKWR